jgi:hypothetical protein
MTQNDEKIFINLDAAFARQVTKRTTSWTLRELMDAAGIPSDAEINEAYRDEYGSLAAHSVVVTREELFDEQGRRLKKVTQHKVRTIEQGYFETTYVPDGTCPGVACESG